MEAKKTLKCLFTSAGSNFDPCPQEFNSIDTLIAHGHTHSTKADQRIYCSLCHKDYYYRWKSHWKQHVITNDHKDRVASANLFLSSVENSFLDSSEMMMIDDHAAEVSNEPTGTSCDVSPPSTANAIPSTIDPSSNDSEYTNTSSSHAASNSDKDANQSNKFNNLLNYIEAQIEAGLLPNESKTIAPPNFSLNNHNIWFPFPDPETSFWVLLYQSPCDKKTALNMVLKFLNMPRYRNLSKFPKKIDELAAWSTKCRTEKVQKSIPSLVDTHQLDSTSSLGPSSTPTTNTESTNTKTASSADPTTNSTILNPANNMENEQTVYVEQKAITEPKIGFPLKIGTDLGDTVYSKPRGIVDSILLNPTTAKYAKPKAFPRHANNNTPTCLRRRSYTQKHLKRQCPLAFS